MGVQDGINQHLLACSAEHICLSDTNHTRKHAAQNFQIKYSRQAADTIRVTVLPFEG